MLFDLIDLLALFGVYAGIIHKKTKTTADWKGQQGKLLFFEVAVVTKLA